MKLKQLYDTIDAVAPFVLSEEYIQRGAYDNSGIMLDCGREIGGVLFSLDLSLAAVQEAAARGLDCIVTHHPAIWKGVMHLDPAHTPALAACVKEGISVLSAHLNLDAAEGGIDECLMRGLGGDRPLARMEELSCGGYGRVYDVPPLSFPRFVSHVQETFHTRRTVCYGERDVRRVASFCGGGFTEETIPFALKEGADTIVSSDPKHHIVAEAVERGLNVLLLTHYAAENYGFSRFAEKIKNRTGIACFCFTDTRLL